MSADDAELEVWIYAGKWMAKGRLRDRWRDPNGKDLLYPSLKADVVGGLYNVKVDRSKGVTVYGRPEWTGERMDDKTLLTTFIVEDNSQRIQHAKLRREINAGKDDMLDQAIAPLLMYARSCTTRYDKDALVATVMRRLYDAW